MAKKRKVTIIAGRLREVYMYTPPNIHDTGSRRAEKQKATTAAQKKLNYKTAQKSLALLLYANFTDRDLFVTLTYSDENLPKNYKDAKKNIKKFVRALRDTRKKNGDDLKYIYTTESKHGDGRIHHHMVMNATKRNDLEEIISLWQGCPDQGIDVERLAAGDTAGRDYFTLARYMTKESNEEKPNGAQMYTTSRNMIRPKKYYEWVNESEIIATPKGAQELEREVFHNCWGQFYYLRYLLPIEAKKQKQPRKPKRKTPEKPRKRKR